MYCTRRYEQRRRQETETTSTQTHNNIQRLLPPLPTSIGNNYLSLYLHTTHHTTNALSLEPFTRNISPIPIHRAKPTQTVPNSPSLPLPPNPRTTLRMYGVPTTYISRNFIPLPLRAMLSGRILIPSRYATPRRYGELEEGWRCLVAGLGYWVDGTCTVGNCNGCGDV